MRPPTTPSGASANRRRYRSRLSPPLGDGPLPRQPGTAGQELPTLVQDYLQEVRGRGRKKKTHEIYELSMRKLLDWTQAHGIERSDQLERNVLSRLSQDLIEARRPDGRPVSRETARTHLRQINFFLGWLEAQGEIARRLRAPVPRAEKRIAKTLDRSQMKALEESARTERDQILIQILSETGIRAAELANLRLRNLIQERGHQPRFHLLVEGKGDEDRLVGVSLRLFRRIQRYIERQRPKDSDSDKVFLCLNRSRRSGLYEEITVDVVQNAVEKAAEAAGLTKADYPKLGPHLLRKSYTRVLLKKGVDHEVIRLSLGHKDTRMIREVYGQMVPEDTYEIIQAALHREDGR